METQMLNELKRISNRLHIMTSLYAIAIMKEFSNDKDVVSAVKTLQNNLRDAENI